MTTLRVYQKDKVLGDISLTEDVMVFSTDDVAGLVADIKEGHFSPYAPDKVVFDELPRMLNGGMLECRGIEDG
jgi:hypothetical protein